MRSLYHKAHTHARKCFLLLSLTKDLSTSKKRNHLHTLHYLSSFHESAKTTAITPVVEGTLPVIEPTQDDQI